MNRPTARHSIAVLGVAVAVALAAGIQSGAAQPRTLPANPQYQDQGPDRTQDPQFAPRDDQRQFGGPADRRDGDRFVNPEERLERRLSFLHTELRITPRQERAWRDFTGVLREEAHDRIDERDQRGRPDDRRGQPSVLERLEDRQHELADRSAGLDRLVRALRPLYASFSVEQKRTADRLMFMPGAGFGFGPERRGGPDFDRGGRDGRDYRS